MRWTGPQPFHCLTSDEETRSDRAMNVTVPLLPLTVELKCSRCFGKSFSRDVSPFLRWDSCRRRTSVPMRSLLRAAIFILLRTTVGGVFAIKGETPRVPCG